MKKYIYLILASLLFTAHCDAANEFSEEENSAAKKLYKLSIEPYNIQSLSQIYIAGGYSEEESVKHATKLLSLIKNDDFAIEIEEIYQNYFTQKELERIIFLLEDPAYKKFLNLRPQIQGDMAKAINNIAKTVK